MISKINRRGTLRNELNCHRIVLVHQYGRRFVILEHNMAAMTYLKLLETVRFSEQIMSTDKYPDIFHTNYIITHTLIDYRLSSITVRTLEP